MSSLSWWRSWHGAPTDHKWAVIAARSGVKVGVVSAIAWALFDYASQHKIRGTVDGFDTEVYAVYSGFAESEIIAVIQAMTDKGIIIDGKLANWEKRQPKREDDSAERVRQFRAMKRSVTQGNAPETEEDTETDSEEDKEKEGETPPPPLDPFDCLQSVLEGKGILASGAEDVKYINDLITSGVIPEDLKQGIDWKAANNGGKAVVRVSQVVGPAKTARAKRLQANGNYNGNGQSKPRVLIGPLGQKELDQ